MELLGTVDWLIAKEQRRPELNDIKAGLRTWPVERMRAHGSCDCSTIACCNWRSID